MVAIAHRKLARSALVVLGLWGTSAYSIAPDTDLHSQSASVKLAREFSDPQLSFLLLNEKGEVVAQRWPEADREAPVGSLIKPFLAAAYGRTHESFPVFHCQGKGTCWLPRGHGLLGLQQAIAFSCNSYFHQLLEKAKPGFAQQTLRSFRLNTHDVLGRDQVDLFEQGRGWKAEPVLLARAYLELAGRSREKAIASVLTGMVLSARTGTAGALSAELPGTPALAKTGTAPCIHSNKAAGDGLAVVMVPADHPRLVLLVRLHGKPGAVAAAMAGRMTAAIENSGPRR